MTAHVNMYVCQSRTYTCFLYRCPSSTTIYASVPQPSRTTAAARAYVQQAHPHCRRDSNLTRILSSSLGGNSKTTIICTINQSALSEEETIKTLVFASQAKCVVNQAQVNEFVSEAALLKRQEREISELKA